jgi:hypothetical protein
MKRMFAHYEKQELLNANERRILHAALELKDR